jgi:ATP-binding cassette, subfamily B, bacterial
VTPIAQFIGSIKALGRAGTRFKPYLKGQRALIVLGVCGMLAEIVFRLAEPWPLKIVVDRVLPVKPVKSMDGLVPATWTDTQVLVLAVGSVAVLAALRAVSAYSNSIAFALVGNRVLTRVRSDMFVHLQRLSLRYHSGARTGDLLTRVIGDVGRLQDVAVTALVPLVVNTVMLIGMLVLMTVINWELGLMAVAMFPILALLSMRMGKRIRETARKQRNREGEASSTAAEGLAAIRTVQALGIEDRIGRSFEASNKGTLTEGVKGARLSASLERSVDGLIGLVTACVLWRGAILVKAEVITLGDLVVFLAYLKNAFKPMRDVAKFAARISKASASAERVIEVLDTKPEIVDAPGARPAPERFESLTLENLDFEYVPGSGHLVLSDFSLNAKLGEKIALVGPSGSGKSTLAGLILRLYDPVRGRVLVNSLDVRELAIASWRRQIALVPQENTLFRMTVRENLRCARPDATDEQIKAACEGADAWRFVQDLPKGLDTLIGERGETLSGGQRRRLALARAALRDTPILVLDEPTSGLDNRSRDAVFAALAPLGKGRLTIIISHDLQTAVDADQVVYIERGKVLERGTHESLMALSGRYAAMFARQSAGGALESEEGARDAVPR